MAMLNNQMVNRPFKWVFDSYYFPSLFMKCYVMFLDGDIIGLLL